jgi:hypothetical protein
VPIAITAAEGKIGDGLLAAVLAGNVLRLY